jgi:hypothetical protein
MHYLYAILAREGESMIDPIQLPILMKAIDFVFDEGRKILEERRERRKSEGSVPDIKEQETAQEIVPAPVQESKETKQDLLSAKIEEKLWQDNQKEIEHLVRLLEKHTGNYYTLKEQYAEFGSIMVPPHILSQMKEKENLIIETKKQLEIALSRVYKKDINLVK